MNFAKHLHDLWFLPSLYKIQIHQEQRHPIIWQCKRFISKRLVEKLKMLHNKIIACFYLFSPANLESHRGNQLSGILAACWSQFLARTG